MQALSKEKILNSQKEVFNSIALEDLQDEVLWEQTSQAARREKQCTLILLEHIKEVQRRRLFASKAYSSLYEYVVRGLGYSESQAYERINALRLISDVHDVKEALMENKITLTTASQVQRFLQVEKKEFKKTYTPTEKQALVKKCENLSKREVEKLLLSLSPRHVEIKEKQRRVSEELTEVKFLLKDDTIKKLEKIKNLKGQMPMSDLFDLMLTKLLEQEEKKTKVIRKKSDEPKASQVQSQTKKSGFPAKSVKPYGHNTAYIAKPVKQNTNQRSGNRCEYIDPTSKKRCESKYRLEFEHVKPRCFGGKGTKSNIMHYCKTHNQLMAIQKLGVKKMSKYLPGLTFTFMKLL